MGEAAGARVDEVGQQLLDAAGRLLASEGPAALTVRRIAAEAGASTMNVYSRFGGKDGVVDRLFVDGFSRLREAMRGVHGEDALAALRSAAQRYRRFAVEHPTYYALMFGGVVPDFHPSTGAVEHATGTLALLADRVADAMRDGLLADGDPMQTAAAMWATCHGVMSLEMHQLGPVVVDWPAVYATATDALLEGLRHHPHGARTADGAHAR